MYLVLHRALQQPKSAMLSYADPDRIREREEELVARHREYVAEHPELHGVLCEFTSAVLTEKPDDVFDFAASWWAKHLPHGAELPALSDMGMSTPAFASPALPFGDPLSTGASSVGSPGLLRSPLSPNRGTGSGSPGVGGLLVSPAPGGDAAVVMATPSPSVLVSADQLPPI